ncbi:MAG: acyl-CoA dehydratase activase [Desulfosalsimonadaceae bacterium]
MTATLHTLGICIGASTVSIVEVAAPAGQGNTDVSNFPPTIIAQLSRSHGGDPRKTLLEILGQVDLNGIDRIVATGRRFRNFVNLSTISEPEAVELAYKYAKPEDKSSPAIVSCGGETFMVYALDDYGRISNVLTGNKCASGTGEFFIQQVRRMGITLDDAAHWSSSEKPYEVSGRCSVFCKSDCTHAINKGVPRSRVTAGLCRMMANKVLELVKNIPNKNIMIVGGSTRNHMMIEYLKQSLPGLIIPDCATYFEAMGAALWGLDNETKPFPGFDHLIVQGIASFDTLDALKNYEHMVDFKTMKKGSPAAGDTCILGLDVGSTTTKAILLRVDDNAIVASVYLYTNGDPVGASRQCYAALLEQVKGFADPRSISITGLGVCGSGRQIAGLHALTKGVINEIIAHAAAAVHFDPDVDTLFEIGGQDAKYTYITNGVPSDYAMNEACSAGTGSFLAESAYETLNLPVEKIADVAVTGDAPPNFNDQCAAFIASDIKTAIHEGVNHENVVAGLVYSICMNYTNRVKGNRPVGEKVFMQGGVCYNRAVPLAMAALSGKPIIVPPEPGLMGAYGVALEIKKRISIGLIEKEQFDLEVLANREANYKNTFICKGGREKCDRGCEIAVIELEGQNYAFGGACNRYYNIRNNIRYDIANLDLVNARERMVFEQFAPEAGSGPPVRGRVGINRSFLVDTYYPFYATFFREIGFEPVLPDTVSSEGKDKRNAAFCHPAEIAHGYFYSLLQTEPRVDYIFLPQVRGIPTTNNHPESQTCPFVQAEPYYLTTTYRKLLSELESRGTVVIKPYINMINGLAAAGPSMIKTALEMGVPASVANKALKKALARQQACFDAMQDLGRQALSRLAEHPENMAVVVFGRPYNAFVESANMGIPHKIASRGVQVIPLDFLPIDDEPSKRHMYWGMGQKILQAARYVKRHKQLFGTYITNFSCGPDSFIIGYFRSIMGLKPSLTLELDSHTADAGIETRIEAFLDIVSEYRQLLIGKMPAAPTGSFKPARTVVEKDKPKVITSSGSVLPMTDPRVKFLIPSMGRLGTELFAAVFRDAGFNVVHSPPADESVLKTGRANTSCKECLPLILTTGKLLNYVYNEKRDNEVLVYFMASASGPCRFGQYAIFMEDLIKRLQIPDVAIFSLTSDNSYYGIEGSFNYYKAWWAIIISDFMEDARSMILANAKDTSQAMEIFEAQWHLIVNEMERGDFRSIRDQLDKTAALLGDIPMKRPPSEVPTILLTGEIFVRRDGLSRQYLTERLAEKGFAVMCSPVSEWIHYLEYNAGINGEDHKMSWKEKVKFYLRQKLMQRYEKKLYSTFSRSKLVHSKTADVKTVVENAKPYVSPKFSGEAILTVGSALTEVASEVAGVIIIGPFGCMPNRISEAILSEIMTRTDKLRTKNGSNGLDKVLFDIERLPFLAIETDGSPYPQLIEAKLEAFCLHAERLHERMVANRH